MCLRDLLKKGNPITNNKEHLKAAIDWLKYAQDATKDVGVSAQYILGLGWQTSYPETTGYIIPTMFDYFRFTKDEDFREREQ